MIVHEMGDWQKFPAPTLERIIVCGWQEVQGRVAGYWWYQEDAADERGYPIDHPGALYWSPFILPAFPEIKTREVAA
ncbi:MAG: hypothetical protein WA940_00305 [Sphingopyxis sp.]